MLIPNTSSHIYLLAPLYSKFYIAQSTFFFFFYFSSCVYVNEDHAHIRTSWSDEIKFCLSTPSPSQHVHGYVVRARAHIRMITAVRASTHSHAYSERERESGEERKEKKREMLKHRETSSFIHSLSYSRYTV